MEDSGSYLVQNDDFRAPRAKHHHHHQQQHYGSYNSNASSSNGLPKTSPPTRTATSATWGLSSCASSSTRQLGSPPSRRRRVDIRTTNNTNSRTICREYDHDPDMETLWRLSLQYRDGCLLLDKKHRQRMFELQYGGSYRNHGVSPAGYSRSNSNTFFEDTWLNLLVDERPSQHHWNARRPEPLSDSDAKPAAIPKSIEKLKNHHHHHSHHHFHNRHLKVQHSRKLPPTSSIVSSAATKHILRDDPLSDFASLVANPDEIQRQQEILDEIQRNKNSSIRSHYSKEEAKEEEEAEEEAVASHSMSSRSTRSYAANTTNSAPTKNATDGSSHRKPAPRALPPQRPNPLRAQLSSQASHPPHLQNNDSSTSSKDQKGRGAGRLSSTCTTMVDDQVKSLSNGTKIRLKGTKHTFRSIAQGQATLVQCPGCHTLFQISSSAKLLYCTTCEQVTPMETAMMAAKAVGSSPSSCGVLDENIACVLQRQEIHVSKSAKRT